MTIRVVSDVSIDPFTKARSQERFTWYVGKFVIHAATGVTLWNDDWSGKERDFISLAGMDPEEGGAGMEVGTQVMTAQIKAYMTRWLAFPESPPAAVGISHSTWEALDSTRLDDDRLQWCVDHSGARLSASAVRRELFGGRHLTLFYRASWREDVRIVTWSRLLGAMVLLADPYEQ